MTLSFVANVGAVVKDLTPDYAKPGATIDILSWDIYGPSGGVNLTKVAILYNGTTTLDVKWANLYVNGSLVQTLYGPVGFMILNKFIPEGSMVTVKLEFVIDDSAAHGNTVDGYISDYTLSKPGAAGTDIQPIDPVGHTVIDAKKPVVISATAVPDPAGAGTVTVTVVFNETMDTLVNPSVKVTDLITDPYTVTKTSYSGDTWVGEFTLLLQNEEKNATISVGLGQDVAGNVMDLNASAGTFEVDTVAPTVVDIAVSDLNITEADVGDFFYIAMNFSETMDNTVAPTIDFIPDVTSTLFVRNNGKWDLSNTRYTANYTIYDGEETEYGVDVTVSGAKDLHGNEGSTTENDMFDVDNVKPTVVSALAVPNPAKNGTVDVTVVFSETMDTTTNPTVTVTDLIGGPYSVSGDFTAGNTWVGNFTLLDNNEEKTATISVTGGMDARGNTMDSDPNAGSFWADSIEPYVSSYGTNHAVITEAKVGLTYILALTYNENMNTSVYPTVTFTPDVSATLTSPGGYWVNAKLYYANYTIADANDAGTYVSFNASDAQDVAGNIQIPWYRNSYLYIDTKEPMVTNIVVSDLNITEADVGGYFWVNVTFSEACDNTVDPTIEFINNVSSTLSFSSDAWDLGDTRYTANYSIADLDQTEYGVDVNVSGAKDVYGNEDPTLVADMFDVDTVKPEVVSATAIPNPAKDESVTVTVVFSEIMDTTVSPTVNVTGLDSSPYAVSESSYVGTTWIGSFTLLDDEEETASISVSDGEDARGNVMISWPPAVTIISPMNMTYMTTSVPLNYSVNEPTSWVGYSLDGVANVTLTGNTTLSGLSYDSHSITVYANGTSGSWGKDTVHFTVEDVTPPVVTIMSPVWEETYYSSSVPLTYRVEEDHPDWVGYSLDGEDNVTLTGNTTLSGLSLDSHELTVYANDTFGNWGSDTVGFAVEDVTPPKVTITSPESTTYRTNSVQLTYKVEEDYPDWVGYSLDGADNETLTGNTKLSGLPWDSHTLTVYANDTSGNWGYSSVSFNMIPPVIPNWPPNAVFLSDPTDIASTSMSLSWTENEDSDFKKYVLYHSTSEDSIDQKVTETTNRSDTSYQMTGLSEETTYYYIVRVVDTRNLFNDSNKVSARTNSPPNPVTLHDPTDITNASMSLSWTENEDSDFKKYVLYHSTSEDSIDQKVTETTNRSDTSYQMTGLSENTTYYYVVSVYDTSGLSSDSNQASARTNKTIPPDNEPPILMILSPVNTTYTTSSVELIWLTNEPLRWAGFNLNGGAITTITGNQTISDLEDNLYNLVLNGTDLAGNNGSDIVSFTIYTVVPDTEPPEITHTPVTDGVEGNPIEISAVITDESGVSEAELHYRKGGDTDYVLLEMSSAGADTYTATIPASFVDDETIEYYILASDGVNEATHPSEAPTTSPHVVDVNLHPDPVALYVPASEAISTDTVELTWSESYEADFRNYVVYMSGSEGVLGDVLKEVAERSETSHTVEELESDTTYYFSVRAYDTGGLHSDSNQLEVHTGIRRIVWSTNLFVFLLLLLPLGVGGAYYYIRKKRASATPGGILT